MTEFLTWQEYQAALELTSVANAAVVAERGRFRERVLVYIGGRLRAELVSPDSDGVRVDLPVRDRVFGRTPPRDGGGVGGDPKEL